MKVKANHPLSEIIARKLFSIESVPKEEMKRMINRACKEAVKWHEKQIEAFNKSDPTEE